MDKCGNLTWNYLHRISTYYPLFPSLKHKKDMENILNSVSSFFPCKLCTIHWEKILENSEMDNILKSRNNLMIWLCEKHNEINVKLGKEIFPCNINKLYERWY